MASSLGTRVFFISTLAIPITCVCNRFIEKFKIYDSFTLTLISIGVTLFVLMLLVASTKADLARLKCQKYPFFVFSWLCFNSVCSLMIALELEGLISGFCNAFLKHGDIHLRSAFGAMLFHWNGIVVYGISSTIIAAITWNNNFHSMLCFWFGSWLNLSLVFIIAILIGKNGPNWIAFTYLVYITVPLHMSSSLFNGRIKGSTADQLPIWKRHYDLSLIFYFFFSSLVAIFRGIIVLDSQLWLCQWYLKFVEPNLIASSPAPFAKVQMLFYMFTYTPAYILFIYHIIKSTTHTVREISLIHAGASMSAQLTHVGASVHSRTPYIFRVPSDWLSQGIFWAVNLLLTVGPLLFAKLCLQQPKYRLKAAGNVRNEDD